MVTRLRKLIFLICLVSVACALLIAVLCFNLSEYSSAMSCCEHYLGNYMTRTELALERTSGNNDEEILASLAGRDGQEEEEKGILRILHNNIYKVLDESRSFLVVQNKGEEPRTFYTQGSEKLKEDEIRSLCEAASADTEQQGTAAGYLYLKQQYRRGDIYCFLDLSDVRTMLLKEMIASFVLIIFLTAMCMLVIWRQIGFAIRIEDENSKRQLQMIADAGHELKTPLAIISANTELLELMQGETEWTDSIMKQVRRMNRLIQDLMTMSRYDSVNGKSVSEPYAIGARLGEILDNDAILFQDKKLALQRDMDDTAVILADPEQMDRLFGELLNNAYKYTKPQGTVCVALKNVGGNVVVSVWNSHERIPEEELDRLFDRFYRNDKSRSKNTEGFGIGLSMAKSIVKRHHGRISVCNEKHGIKFEVILPSYSGKM